MSDKPTDDSVFVTSFRSRHRVSGKSVTGDNCKVSDENVALHQTVGAHKEPATQCRQRAFPSPDCVHTIYVTPAVVVAPVWSCANWIDFRVNE